MIPSFSRQAGSATFGKDKGRSLGSIAAGAQPQFENSLRLDIPAACESANCRSLEGLQEV